jgi:hypothetical protein
MVNIWKLKKSLNYLAKQKIKYEKKKNLFMIRKIKEEQSVIKDKINELKKTRKFKRMQIGK